MVGFNREGFSEGDEQTLGQRLADNLKMQRDCEIEIERYEKSNNADGAETVRMTLDVLKLDEEEIRKQLNS